MSSSESSELVEFELSFPLSLQDMCKVHILLRFEEFPVETLALLPLKIRRKLFLALSHANLLHLDDGTGTAEALFEDIYMDADHTLHALRIQRRASVARRKLQNILTNERTDHYTCATLGVR